MVYELNEFITLKKKKVKEKKKVRYKLIFYWNDNKNIIFWYVYEIMMSIL